MATVRAQVIHNDMHGDNVLVASDSDESIAGIIDFGDMLRSPLIIDLGVAGAYLQPTEGDTLSLVAAFVAAYHSVTPLRKAEIDILYFLIRARLAATIAIHYWRTSARASEDPYLEQSADGGVTSDDFLQRLDAIPYQEASARLRAACA